MTDSSVARILKDLHNWYPSTADVAVRAGFRCEYCGRDFLASVDDYESFQIDHVVPKSKCPRDSVNELDNLALACKPCNFFKRAVMPEGSSREDKVRWAARYIQGRRLERLKEVVAIP